MQVKHLNNVAVSPAVARADATVCRSKSYHRHWGRAVKLLNSALVRMPLPRPSAAALPQKTALPASRAAIPRAILPHSASSSSLAISLCTGDYEAASSTAGKQKQLELQAIMVHTALLLCALRRRAPKLRLPPTKKIRHAHGHRKQYAAQVLQGPL